MPCTFAEFQELQELVSLHKFHFEHTDQENSAKVAAVLGPFGVALLDASGAILLQSRWPISAAEVEAHGRGLCVRENRELRAVKRIASRMRGGQSPYAVLHAGAALGPLGHRER